MPKTRASRRGRAQKQQPAPTAVRRSAREVARNRAQQTPGTEGQQPTQQQQPPPSSTVEADTLPGEATLDRLMEAIATRVRREMEAVAAVPQSVTLASQDEPSQGITPALEAGELAGRGRGERKVRVWYMGRDLVCREVQQVHWVLANWHRGSGRCCIPANCHTRVP